MNERKFVQQLQERAQEQEHTLRAVPFPTLFTFVARWLSVHPWRLLIPLAFLLTVALRLILGPSYTTGVLAVFRWFS